MVWPSHHSTEFDLLVSWATLAAMPPKGGKSKAKSGAADSVVAIPADFSLELRQGEKDRSNTDYLLALEEALATIESHPLFHRLEHEPPRGISASAEDTGFQCVFNSKHYEKAIASGTYTAGANLFWLDMRWSATPGVPLRLSGVLQLAKHLFHSPTPYPGSLHVAASPGYAPLDHRGSWHSLSPEELHHAMVFAVADAIRSEPDNLDMLNDWKRCLLSTTFMFKSFDTAEQRMWYALQQRENVSAVHLVVHRSCFQRCHELSRLRQRLLDTMSAPDITPQVLFNAYTTNLRMVANASGTVTPSFCDNASTIVQKLLDVPEINAVMLQADS